MNIRALSAQLLSVFPPGKHAGMYRAAEYAERHLSGLLRRSGENYAMHGREVAATLAEFWPDASLARVAVLHDLLVHPRGKTLLNKSPLNAQERSLVHVMHELRRLHIDANVRDLDTAIDAFTRYGNLLPSRMAHRHNDVRHLARFAPALRRQIAHESLHMYGAIAGRLGMQRLRQEMEDISFSFLHPTIARSLQRKFASALPLDTMCLDHTRSFLDAALRKRGMTATVEGRRKSLYSTYCKMVIRRRRFDELTDRLAVRVIVDDVETCYRALGIIHAVMHPMPGKLKDYIGAPKENGYQSIHTVVFPLAGITEQPIEIQIRTTAMHQAGEFGIAAHESYKMHLYALELPTARVDILSNLLSLRDEARTPKQFESVLRQYFRDDRLAVFDARNNLYNLKRPSTIMDFCCHVYGRRCLKIKQVLLNGRPRGIDTTLNDGDTIDTKFARGIALSPDASRACRQPVLRRRLTDFFTSRAATA